MFDTPTIVIFTSAGAFFSLLNTYFKLRLEQRSTYEDSIFRKVCDSNLRIVTIALATIAVTFFIAVAYKAAQSQSAQTTGAKILSVP